jgi:hypothetical protein
MRRCFAQTCCALHRRVPSRKRRPAFTRQRPERLPSREWSVGRQHECSSPETARLRVHLRRDFIVAIGDRPREEPQERHANLPCTANKSVHCCGMANGKLCYSARRSPSALWRSGGLHGAIPRKDRRRPTAPPPGRRCTRRATRGKARPCACPRSGRVASLQPYRSDSAARRSEGLTPA